MTIEMEDEHLQNLLPEIYQWALSHGLSMYPQEFSLDQTTILPITVFPTPIKRESYEQAAAVQVSFNELYAKISQSQPGSKMFEQIEQIGRADKDFSGKLLGLYKKIGSDDSTLKQKVRLGIFRSDYLIDLHDNIKQVEFNTISVSFAALSSKLGEMHKFLSMSERYGSKTMHPDDLIVSESESKLPEAMAWAIEAYQKQTNPRKKPVVAFIVQRDERNVFDQRALEYKLWENHNIKTIRLDFSEVMTNTELEDGTGKLIVKSSGDEVGLVYYRTGYGPSDYQSPSDWDARLKLESSFAIKAPDLLTQLSGTKKIQQLLTNDKTLKEFIKDDDKRLKVSDTFVNIYPLDDSDLGKQGKRLAFENPSKYVLKPQREGGGNNVYKSDIPGFLESIEESEWGAYILMEIIETVPNKSNVILRGHEVFKEPIASELGIYGCVLFDDRSIIKNEYSGSLLRSKFETSNEGGVAAGFGCLDSFCLY